MFTSKFDKKWQRINFAHKPIKMWATLTKIQNFPRKSKPPRLSGWQHKTVHLNNFSAIGATEVILTDNNNIIKYQLKIKKFFLRARAFRLFTRLHK